jgi:hypothetical protein
MIFPFFPASLVYPEGRNLSAASIESGFYFAAILRKIIGIEK